MQPIGNLAKKIASTAENSGTETMKSTQKPQNSALISTAPTLQNPSKNPGTMLGGDGLEKTKTVALQSALQADDPSATDRALEASLPPSVKTSVLEIWTDKGNAQTGWDGELTGIQLTKPMPISDLKLAAETVRKSMARMHPSEIQKGLARLRVLTKVRAETTDDIRLSLAIYADEMANYPADVIRYVIKTQPKIIPWWPAWSELSERLDLYTRKRQRLLDAIEKAIRTPIEPQNPPIQLPHGKRPYRVPAHVPDIRTVMENYGEPLTEDDLEARKAEFLRVGEGGS